MKKIVTDERYEMQGSSMCWIWLLIGLLWLMQSVLRMTEGEGGLLLVCGWICAAASLLNAVIWMRYRLTADEKGLTMTQGWSTVSFTWEELEKVTVYNRVSFWKSTGLTFHPAGKKPLFIGSMELLPLVRRYSACAIEEKQ